MSERKDELSAEFEDFDKSKRDTMRRMVAAAAFAVPVVASFSVDSLTISRAMAGPNATITPPAPVVSS